MQENSVGEHGGGYGGGLIHCNGSILNNIIAANSAENGGGGLSGCNGSIHNNVITGNSAGDGGGGGCVTARELSRTASSGEIRLRGTLRSWLRLRRTPASRAGPEEGQAISHRIHDL